MSLTELVPWIVFGKERIDKLYYTSGTVRNTKRTLPLSVFLIEYLMIKCV